MGTRPPESLAREEACALEKNRAAWQQPEPEPPPLIDKIYPTGSFEGSGVLHGAAKSLANYHDIDHELYPSGGGPPRGTRVPVTFSFPSCNVSVDCPAMRVIRVAATQHFEFTRNSTLHD